MSDTHFTLGHLSAARGEFVSGYLPIAEMSHGGVVSIPVFLVNGARPGPTLWLNGAVHGDELNGPMAIRSLVPGLDPQRLTGRIVATPISNPLAFQARQKNTPQDGLDLDMQFPGDPHGTLSQRMAATLFGHIRAHATHLIDCHTLGSHYQAEPYTVFKRLPDSSPEVCDEAERLARAFGATVHCRVDFGGSLSELPGNTKGFLDVQGMLHGIPAFMIEVGNGGEIDPEMVAWTERGLLAVLHALSMWPEEPEASPVTDPPTITRRRFLYADRGGLCVDTAPPGSVVPQGELICRIVDMMGTLQEVRAEQDVYIIARRRNPPVDQGDRIAFVGLEWS